LHSRAIGCLPACASIQAYFTVTLWQSTPPLFFKISSSTLAEANSRRNRSTSASSSFADRGVALTPAEDSSLPARSYLT